VTLPAGAARNGLPLGLQCVGLPGADEELLAWSALIAAVLPG
jgi:Asp-tRNA(Asn)/Glu-tRNA(Gln) amidotransferase A subunit family amidase